MINIVTEGRRHYLQGDTYSIRDAIKCAGCKWDADRRMWWTGKREIAEKLIARLDSGEVKPKAGFVKLDTGSWGARVPGGAKVGDEVELDSKFGRKTVKITKIVETRDDAAICEIEMPKAKRRPDGRGYRRGDRDYNIALRNYRQTGDYYGSGLYDEES